MFTSRNLGLSALVGAAFTFGGCAEPVEDVDRTQPNALKKSLFEGEWYYARTVIDAPYETDGAFVGDRQEYLAGAEDFPAYKVRWRIEEDRLLACRVDETVIGANGKPARSPESEIDPTKQEARAGADAKTPGHAKFPCDNPVASFRIESHFDIIRQYNATTGEQTNVISENTSDRHWHERDYIRVDWTDIGITDVNFSLDGFAGIGFYRLQSKYYVQEEAGDCRQFVNGGVDYSACEEGFLPPVIEDDSFLITNRLTVTPGDGLFECFVQSYYGSPTPCVPVEIGMRYSFRKVPERAPEEQYEPAYYPDEKFERFGIWRITKPVYTPGRGLTDFKDYIGTRWHIWQQTQDCSSGECTPLPFEQREIRPIVYYLNRQFPRDLVPAAFGLAKEWNDAYNGIKPNLDLTKSCKVVCADGKPGDQCSATDENWRMEGTCAFELRENDGNKFLGDLRYNFIAYIEDASIGQPCGVGGPANDPETGELINAVSYVYGAGCFDWIETTVTDMVDILCAQHRREGAEQLPKACRDIDENQFLRGLNVLEIMQAQGYKQPPRTPIRAITRAGYNFASDSVAEELQDVKLRMEELQQHKSTLHTRRKILKEAGLDRMLIPDELAWELSGGRARTAQELTDDEVALFNPLDPTNSLHAVRQRHFDRLASRGVESAEYIFNDAGLWAFAKKHLDKDREQFTQLLREEAFRAVTLHELGHNMGLRHNFNGSFDRTNFFPQYWEIKKAAEAAFTEETGRPVPAFEPFFNENNETAEQFYERYQQWDEDRNRLRQIQEEMGIKQYRYSSIMDYGALLYTDWEGLGSYDKAAMRFMYADLVDRVDCEAKQPEGCNKLQQRQHVKWYLGGELCDTDSDCPAAAAGQKCRPDDRITGNLGVKVCSNWDRDETASGRFNPRHMFCSDDRVADQPFCNRFDEGESSEEIVRSMIDTYERMFVFNNFRRYRASFTIGGYYNRIFSRYFSIIGDQMQSLLYKYFYEPGFRNNQGPGGFYDMFRATAIGLDFLGNVLAQPEAGSYQWNRFTGKYEQIGDDLVDPALENEDLINIPLGQGKTLYSSYEVGYFGEGQRLSYVGIYYDKIAALRALTLRDWGSSSLTNEQRFQLSFYDFFPGAYVDLLGALMSRDTLPIALQYDPESKTLQQRTFWDGTFFSDEDGFDPRSLNPTGRQVEPGASTLLNVYALIYGAINTPYYLDLSFTNSMRVFELGGQTSFSLEGIDPDDLLTCDSPLTHRTFVSVRTEAIDSISWRTIQRCRELAGEFAMLEEAVKTGVFPEGMSRNEAVRELRNTERRLSQQEDVLANLTYIGELLGIGSL